MEKILRNVANSEGSFIGYMIFCPACSCGHLFYTEKVAGRPCWVFNGDIEKPSFTPSMLVNQDSINGPRCHSYVTDGKIHFLDDCTHHLKGQVVDLEYF